MYSGTQIKDIFYTLWDTTQSGTFSNAKLNNIFQKAEVQYLYNLMDAYGLNISVANEANTYLVEFTIIPSNNTIDVSETSVEMPNFERLVNIKFKFSKGGITYYEYAREIKAEEFISPLKGNVTYPKYFYTNDSIKILPSNQSCLEAGGIYFRTIFGIDVASATANLPYTDKNVESIVNQALNIAAQVTREDGFYSTTEREIAQNDV
jgi:hypothetical protein